jgi:hypothetical protein
MRVGDEPARRAGAGSALAESWRTTQAYALAVLP